MKGVLSLLVVLCMLAGMPVAALAQAPEEAPEVIDAGGDADGGAIDFEPEEADADTPADEAGEDAPPPAVEEGQPDAGLLYSFFASEMALDEETEPPSHYALSEDFGGVQGPYWYYRYLNSVTGQLGEMTYDAASAEARWVSAEHANHWMRIFADGMMPTNKTSDVCDCEPVLEWVAPKAGLIEISAGQALRMEEVRADRDGVLARVLHNSAQLWPDAGGMAVDPNNGNSTEFDTLRVYVEAGDAIRFAVNKRDIPNNDRLKWAPVIDYVDAGLPVMGTVASAANGRLSFAVSGYAGTPATTDVALFARVDNAPRQSVAVTAVALEDGVLTVDYAPVLPAAGQETAVVQLSCLFAGDSRLLTYVATDSNVDTVTVTAKAGAGGAIEPAGEVAVPVGGSQVFTFTPDYSYVIDKVELDGEELDEADYADGTYTLADVQAAHTLSVWFAAKPVVGGVTYYVSPEGDDEADGTSEDTPWKSLDKVNETTFQPGDSILFKSGGIWTGWLWPKGSGAPGNPITLGKYGGEAYPIFNSSGDSPLQATTTSPTSENRFNPTVFLCDQSHWVVEHLEVTNNARNDRNNQGILIYTTGTVDSGRGDWRVYDVTVRECYVHDVTSTTASAKLSGGILGMGSVFHIDGSTVFPSSENVSRRDRVGFDGLVFEYNHVKNVAKEGVRTSGSGDSSPFRNRKTHRNVTIRGNYIEEVFGDGIVIAEVGAGGLVEHNVVKNHCNYSTVNYAGLWDWYCNDTVVRYNEVFGGEYGYNDGEAFDFDNGSTNFTYEYNFSHHNKGGLLLTMSGAGQATNNFRYNISVNDGKESQALFHIPTQSAKVYNNTMYIGRGYNTSVYDGSGNTLNFFKNNILLVHGEMPSFSKVSLTLNSRADITNNIFYPASIMAVGGLPEDVLTQNILLNPGLSSPHLFEAQYRGGYDGLTPETMGRGDAFVSGMRLRAQNFKLAEGSIAIDAGVNIPGAPATDFYGNPLADGKTDIGAHEFSGDPGPADTSGANDATDVRLDKAAAYLTIGQSTSFTATVLPAGLLDGSVSWSTSAPGVASVTAAGKVEAVGVGEAVITARSNATPAVLATCRVLVGESEQVVYPAVKDTFIRGGNSTNNASATLLQVKNDTTNYTRHMLLGFTLTDVPETYAKVVLRLYAEVMDNANTLNFHEIGFDWAESVVWNTAPAQGELAFTAPATATGSGAWLEVDITDYIAGKDLAENPDLAFRVSAAANMQNKNDYRFTSRESSTPPQIVFVQDTVREIAAPLVRTVTGTAPVLPETVTVHYLDGTSADMAVAWEAIAPESYAAEGSFAVVGTISGIARPVLATVRVLEDWPEAILPVEVETPAGVAPALPETVTATMAAGGEKTLPVVWAAIPPARYAAEGSFTVAGAIDDYEGSFAATVTVGPAVVQSIEAVEVAAIAGYAPILPGEVDCLYTDGTRRTVPVQWEDIDPASYANAGSFEVVGTADGAEAALQVQVVAVAGVEAVSLTNPQGKYPALPATVSLSVGRPAPLAWPVAWQPVPAESYNGTEDFEVTGHLAGTLVPVTASVTQTAAIEESAGSLAVAGDTFIRMGTSNQTNGGNTLVMPKGYTGNYKRDGLFQFDLSGVEDLEHVTTLTLRLAVEGLDKLGSGYLEEYWFSLYANGSSWNEATASWDNISQNGAEYKQKLLQSRVVVTTADVGGYVEIDVSEALGYVDSEGRLSFLVAIDENPPASNDGQNGGINFYAKEHTANKPAMLDFSTSYITAVEPVECVVELGEMPALPATVKVTTSGGEVLEKAVAWDGVSRDQVGAEGTFYVRGAVQGLYTDISATVVVRGPVYHLGQLVEQCSQVADAGYTTGSWAAFRQALAAAEELLGQPGPDMQQAREAYDALMAARLGLVKYGDRTALQFIISICRDAAEEDFTPGSWAVYAEALALAQRMASDEEYRAYTDAEMIEAGRALTAAYSALIRGVDKSALAGAIEVAEGLLADGKTYLESSVAALRALLVEAKALMTDADATQQQVDDMVEALAEAIWNMLEQGDKTLLNALVQMMEGYDAAAFTPASWAPFEEAMAFAKRVLASGDAVQELIDKARDELMAAASALVRRASKAALTSEIALAQRILDSRGDYVAATLSGLQEALDAARLVEADANATQQQVNTALAALQSKVLAARKKVDLTALIEAMKLAEGLISGERAQLYTTASVNALRSAMQTAAALTEESTQAELDTAMDTLQNAILSLERKTDYAGGNNGTIAPAGTGGTGTPRGGAGGTIPGAGGATAPAGTDGTGTTPPAGTPAAGEDAAADPEANVQLPDIDTPQAQPAGNGQTGASLLWLWVLLALALTGGVVILVVYKRRQAKEKNEDK